MLYLKLGSPALKAWETQEKAPGGMTSEWSNSKVRTAEFASYCPFLGMLQNHYGY